MDRPRILVVDDEKVVTQLFKRALEEKNYEVLTAENGCEALQRIEKRSFNLLIIDLKMPGMSGVDVLKEIKKINPYIEVIVITGYPTVELAVEAIKIGAYDFICKPFEMDKMRLTIEGCLERQKLNISHIQISELMTLFEVGKTVTAVSNLDSLLGRILDSALEITKAKKGLLLMLSEGNGELSIKAARGLHKDMEEESMIRFGEVILDRVAKEKRPVLVNHIDEIIPPRKRNVTQHRFTQLLEAPLLSIPLHSQGNILGVVGISSKITGETFTEREQTLLSVLASQAAAAIENAKLYKQLEDRIKRLRQTINQLNHTQNQLIQTEKMAAVGRLAFGIAHEIRNPLAIISEGVDFLKGSLLKKDGLAEGTIKKIKRCVERANSIIIELLKFSRTSEIKLQPVKICKLLDDTVILIRNQANLRNIRIRRDFPEKDIQIEADYNMLRQAFFNLCINAIDAMPKGGSLRIGVCRQREKKSKNKIIIEIEDTGKGVPKNKLSKIFEPFFTTKEQGKGAGLGLSVVHLILQRHKAAIQVQSQIGKGTKFIIKLPVS